MTNAREQNENEKKMKDLCLSLSLSTSSSSLLSFFTKHFHHFPLCFSLKCFYIFPNLRTKKGMKRKRKGTRMHHHIPTLS